MLMSRVFALMLGTSLFVLIWTCQDEGHSTAYRNSTAATSWEKSELIHILRQNEGMDEGKTDGRTENSVSRNEPTLPQQTDVDDPLMWVFADEPELRDHRRIASE